MHADIKMVSTNSFDSGEVETQYSRRLRSRCSCFNPFSSSDTNVFICLMSIPLRFCNDRDGERWIIVKHELLLFDVKKALRGHLRQILCIHAGQHFNRGELLEIINVLSISLPYLANKGKQINWKHNGPNMVRMKHSHHMQSGGFGPFDLGSQTPGRNARSWSR